MYGLFSARKIWITAILVIFASQFATFFLVHKLDQQVYDLQLLKEKQNLIKTVEQNIVEKQLSTTAIALSISLQISELQLNEALDNQKRLQRLIKLINTHTDYKNLWMQIVDPQGDVLYRSWNSTKDNLLSIRPEFSEVKNKLEPLRSISSGRFDLTLKSVTPIFKGSELVGFLDLISHFNSIQYRLQELGIDSLVVANKARSKLITRPFSSNRIGEYYVANLKPNQAFYESVTEQKLEKWFKNQEDYWIESDKLFIKYPLIAIDGETHGYLFASTEINEFGSQKEEASELKALIDIILEVNLIFIIAIIMGVALYLNMRQKAYYRDILNYEQEAVLVTNGHYMVDANNQLFKYFPPITKRSKKCICDFFVDAPGFLQKHMDGTLWIDYVLQHPTQRHKVLTRFDKERVFSLRATRLGKQDDLFVIVLSDITAMERLNKKLLQQSRTDELTRLGNRLSFNETIEREIDLSIQSQRPLSIILFDIDFFKKVNDTFGHLTGDQVLKELAELVQSQLNTPNLIFRFGGEEFIVVLPNLDDQAALSIAEKIRTGVANHQFADINNISVSLGVTQYNQGEHLNEMLTRADAALYQAKNSGRNNTQLIKK